MQRIVKRPDLLTIFFMIFLADVAIGIYRATFSLFADSLGATLTTIGVLSGLEGLMGILLSVPIGVLSDKIDRRNVLGGGLLLFGLAYLLCTLADEPLFLYPIRAMSGIGVASTFYVGIAFVGDITEKRDRGLAIGIYTTCMGIGFAIGSAIGGQLAERIGFDAGFAVAAAVVLASFLVLRLGPARQAARPRPASSKTRVPFKANVSVLLRDPAILATSLGNLGISMSNEGAVFSFFPLYAASLGIGKAMIGGMFSIRMIGSSATRLPSGAIANRIPTRYLMMAALAIGTTSVLSMAFVTDHALLTLLLACEGIAFGMYFASGTTTIAEHTEEANRGTATGLFTMAGSFGTTLGPIGLGRAADSWGLSSVFTITGMVLLIGLLGNLILYSRARTRKQAGIGTGPHPATGDRL